MKISHRVGAVFVCVSVIGGAASWSSGGAFAQTAGACSCLAPPSAADGAIGRLTQIEGNVQISQAGGYAAVKAEAPVYPGARIMTGPRSSALLGVGDNCALDIPANATVKIDPAEGGMCISFDTPETKVVPASSGAGLGPIVLGGGAIGGAAALILGLHDDDSSVSK
jgi:hypothetical protein